MGKQQYVEVEKENNWKIRKLKVELLMENCCINDDFGRAQTKSLKDRHHYI